MHPSIWKTFNAPMAAEKMDSFAQKPQINEMIQMVPSTRGRILCLGCGDGTELAFFRESIGASLNAEGIRWFRDRSVVADMHCLPFRESTFTGVFCKDTFEHALSPWIAMSEMCRVAAEWVFIATPDESWENSPHHVLIPTIRQMTVMARKLGWKIAHTRLLVELGRTWNMECFLLTPEIPCIS